MEEQDQDWIERYFRGELPTAEQAAFERRAATDAAFGAEVELHRKALQAIGLLEKEVVLRQLAQKGRELDAQRRPGVRWLWLGSALLLLLAIWGWWRWGQTPVSQPLPPDSPRVDPPPDTLPLKPAPGTPNSTTPQNPPPVALDRAARERLFAANFSPHKDPSLEPSLRGGAQPAPAEQFQQHYWEGRYGEALALFDSLPPAAQTNDNLLFVRAECWLATGQAALAVPVLEQILRNDRTRYMDAAAWHLALAYLRLGRLDAARAQLQHLRRNPASPWRNQAAALLRRIS
ncbi:MAG: hypothetical protein IT260_14110 [Saprospiraceae bacterium]|nr:hypothetical protein [Saprospiraceae bacterium]